jgi:drug/metabolite transporter (DMT)-like permease
MPLPCRSRRPLTPARIAPAASNPARGIAMMLLCVLLFSCMDAAVKFATTAYPIGQIVFFRNIVAFLPIAFYVNASGGLAALRTDRLGVHFLRTLFGLGAMVAGFLGYSLLPLGDAVALEQSGPIFLTALSVPLLGERVGIRRWSAVIVGFVGVLIMTRPGAGVFDPAALLPLSAALLYAVAMIAIRKMSRSEPAAAIVFYFTVIGATAGALSLPFQWHGPDGFGLVLLVGIGLLGGGAQITMTLAFRLAPVALLAPFGYAGLVFAMGFGYVIWGEIPDAYLLIGAAVVVASGLYILHRETTLRRRAAATPAPA